MSLSAAKSQGHQVLARRYFADLEESLAMQAEDIGRVNVLAWHLKGEASCKLKGLTEGPTLSIPVRMGVNYCFLREAGSVVSESISSSVVDLLQLTVRGVEAACMKFILVLCMDSIGSTLASTNLHFDEIESQIASKKLERKTAAKNMSLIKRRLCVAEDLLAVKPGPSQGHGP